MNRLFIIGRVYWCQAEVRSMWCYASVFTVEEQVNPLDVSAIC
jgi:hypothetical protein